MKKLTKRESDLKIVCEFLGFCVYVWPDDGKTILVGDGPLSLQIPMKNIPYDKKFSALATVWKRVTEAYHKRKELEFTGEEITEMDVNIGSYERFFAKRNIKQCFLYLVDSIKILNNVNTRSKKVKKTRKIGSRTQPFKGDWD